MSNHMIKNVAEAIFGASLTRANLTWNNSSDEMKAEFIDRAIASIEALKENSPNSFIAEIINRHAGLHPMDEHGRKLWNNLIDAVLNMKEKT